MRVFYSRRAQSDIETIFTWIAQRSPSGARNWLAAFDEAIDFLILHPEGRARAPEAMEGNPKFSQKLFGTKQGRTYRILFVIENDELRILAVRAPGQDLLTLDELKDAAEDD